MPSTSISTDGEAAMARSLALRVRLLGRQLQNRGAEALLDMRVRTGGSHHQKMVVIRYRDDPSRDVAYIGAVTRYIVDLDGGGEIQVVKQNLEMSSQEALEQRGRRGRHARSCCRPSR